MLLQPHTFKGFPSCCCLLNANRTDTLFSFVLTYPYVILSLNLANFEEIVLRTLLHDNPLFLSYSVEVISEACENTLQDCNFHVYSPAFGLFIVNIIKIHFCYLKFHLLPQSEAVTRRCSIKQLFEKLHRIQRKISVLEALFQ